MSSVNSLLIFFLFFIILSTFDSKFSKHYLHENFTENLKLDLHLQYKLSDSNNSKLRNQQRILRNTYWEPTHFQKQNIVRDFSIVPTRCSNVPLQNRLNCFPFRNVTKEKCMYLNCCWNEKNRNVSNAIIPSCYFSTDTIRYNLSNVHQESYGISGILSLVKPSGIPNEVYKLKLNVSFCDDTRLRLSVRDYYIQRYEVPTSFLSFSCFQKAPIAALYDINLFPNGTLIIKRKHSSAIIFSTDFTTLLYGDQFLQLSSSLASNYVYGLGDHLTSLLKSTNWTKYTFFNRDQIPEENMNLYSSFPFYMVMENSGKSHGVYLLNSNAMDILLQPAPAITFRTVGGILDFFFFLGPSPNDVVRQFSELIGYPALPPYWSLGFHLSRLGYFTLNKTREVWNRTVQAGIPFDTQWNDIDYMDNYNDFTFDKQNFEGLPNFIDSLHHVGMHYVLIIDPGISNAEPKDTYPPFDDGLAMDIFVKNESGQLLETKVWNKVSSVFPDFTNPSSSRYWKKQLSTLHSVLSFDGVWLDMNEPTNFLNGSFVGCPENASLEHPPYVPGDDALYTKTICMTAEHYVSKHYNMHNIYGIYETEATYKALSEIRAKRPFVLTRAGFPGIGRFGAMWNGDVISLWEHMQASIPSLLGFNMAGIPMVGADICGFNNNTSVELCARWFSLGAFYPFCRNHNSDENIEQDPVALGPKVLSAAKSSLSVRYYLLPYLYTLLFLAHTSGDAVIRPLFFEFANDITSYHNDRQFLWGQSLMIIPALEPNVLNIQGYFPPDIWYDFYTGRKFKSSGQTYMLDAPLDKINLFIRSGHILPAQKAGNTTTFSRNNKFTLLVALNSSGEARGTFFWDDGESLDVYRKKNYNLLHFFASKGSLKSTIKVFGYEMEMLLGNVRVFGVLKRPKKVIVNDVLADFHYNTSSELLEIQNLSVSLTNELRAFW